MIRLFASDLDGTFLNKQHEVDDFILETVDEILRQNKFFAVSTGRHLHLNENTHSDYGDRKVYTICMNGALIYDWNYTILYKQAIEPDFIRELVAAFPTLDISYICEHATYSHISKDEHIAQIRRRHEQGNLPVDLDTAIRRFTSHVYYSQTLDEVLKQEVLKINFRIVDDEVLEQQVRTFLNEHRHQVVNAPFQAGFFELTHKDVNKGNGVMLVAKLLGIEPDEVAVYGDGYNDLEMLEMFEHSYAPQNSVEDAKKAARHEIGHYHDYAVSKHIRETLRMENPLKKIVFVDVDGTLVDYEGKLPESAVQAIRQARANGHKVYLSTGRSKAEIYDHIWNIGFDGIIGGNGNFVEHNGQVVLHQLMTKQQCQRVVEWLHQRGLEFYLESNNGLFGSEHFDEQGNEPIREYSKRKGLAEGEQVTVRSVFKTMIFGADLIRDDVNKISFVLLSYQDYLDAKEAFPDMKVSTWGGKGETALFGDVGVPDVSKATAIHALLDVLGADIKDTIALGDAKVDIPMLEACAIGVAMGSGGDEIKEVADFITKDTDDDGLAFAFQHFGLI